MDSIMHADHMVIILYLTWASILIRQGGILIYLTEVKYWCSFPMTENCLLKVKIFKGLLLSILAATWLITVYMYKSTGIEKNVSQYQLPTRKIIFILFLTKLIKTSSQNLITPLLSLCFYTRPQEHCFQLRPNWIFLSLKFLTRYTLNFMRYIYKKFFISCDILFFL